MFLGVMSCNLGVAFQFKDLLDPYEDTLVEHNDMCVCVCVFVSVWVISTTIKVES